MNASITLYLFLKNVPTINFILQILSFAVSLRKRRTFSCYSHILRLECRYFYLCSTYFCTDSPSNNDSLFTVYFVTYFNISHGFSFQVLQESWTINPETLKDAAYSPQWLWIPLGIGLILTLYNAWHGLRTMIKYKTDKHSKSLGRWLCPRLLLSHHSNEI